MAAAFSCGTPRITDARTTLPSTSMRISQHDFALDLLRERLGRVDGLDHAQAPGLLVVVGDRHRARAGPADHAAVHAVRHAAHDAAIAAPFLALERGPDRVPSGLPPGSTSGTASVVASDWTGVSTSAGVTNDATGSGRTCGRVTTRVTGPRPMGSGAAGGGGGSYVRIPT